MQVQRQYDAIRAGGKSVQQAIRDIEDIFDIYKVSVDSSGKTVVNFKINEDAFTDALSKFTGMKFDACPRCGELLAHRGGKPLPCTNVKCPLRGKPVNEAWFANIHDRDEAEKDWIDAHPGYEFGVYSGNQLVSTHPSVPSARRAAKKLAGKGKNIRVKDVKHPDRSYWHEEADLTEAVDSGLLKNLQDQGLPVRHLYEVWNYVDAQHFKFELSTCKRLRMADVDFTAKVNGKSVRIVLPLAQGEELARAYNANMRGLKKYVQSRW
jgi:hypothetical protein